MSYADDNTLYVCYGNVDVTLEKTRGSKEKYFLNVSKQFLKGKSWQFNLILSKDEPFSIDIDNEVIKNSNNKKLLRIKLSSRLSFDTRVTNNRNWAWNKLHALAGISQFLNINKHRMTMKAFYASEFGYCSLIWMFHCTELNSRVNKLHERTLRIMYQVYASSFTELFKKDNSATTHNRNIKLLATELFKVKNGLSRSFMK